MENKYTISISPKSKINRKFLNSQINNFYLKFIECSPNYANDIIHFVIGGDGTLLNALRENDYKGKYIIIKESGHLGFYSEFNKLKELEEITIENVFEEDFHPVCIRTKKEEFCAANELVLINDTMLAVFDLTFNDTLKLKCKSSGLIFTSRLGSTGLSLSSGGPVILNKNSTYMKLLSPTIYEKDFNKIRACVLDINHIVKIKQKRTRLSIISDGKKCSSIEGTSAILTSREEPFTLLHFESNFLHKRYNKL